MKTLAACRFVAIGVLAVATAAPVTVAVEPLIVDERVAAAVAERAALGLQSDVDYVTWLLNSGADVGTGHLGIPLTAAEEAEFAFDERAAFADAVAATIIPFAERLGTYAGAYIDQPAGGGLVIVLTGPDAGAEATIAGLAPDRNLGIRFQYAKSTARELEAAASSAWALNGGRLPTDAIWSVGIDYATNSIRLSIRPGQVDGASGPELSALLGVSVSVVEEPVSVEAACTRDNCVSPMRAGIRIYRGANPPNDENFARWRSTSS